MMPLDRRLRPWLPVRRWYRVNKQLPSHAQQVQWLNYVRSENLRRYVGGDQLESQEFRVEAQAGWFESLPGGGATFQQQNRAKRFSPIIALRGGKLSRRCFRTPITERGLPSEGMPLHVTLPKARGVIPCVQLMLRWLDFRVTLKLEKWSDRTNPRSVERTAYRVVGGSLFRLLEVLETLGYDPPKADQATGLGVWHVSC